MGKKRVAVKSEEELLSEREKVESSVSKAEVKKKQKVRYEEGNVYVFSTYNNTILTLTDNKGNVLYWASAGSIGFSGTKKSTPFAASKVAEAVAQTIKKLGIPKIKIFMKGIGVGRESAMRTLASRGPEVTLVKDVTPIPHNGPRPKKVRRV